MYKVFGYTDDCHDYEFNNLTFVQAVNLIRQNQFDVIMCMDFKKKTSERMKELGYWF